ncbi:MAG: hypothetical protein M1268_03760 [Patescibacteria group bacterium]|nr:hypothetical protein [Actinomycetota bacterium]MCL5439078.1 hypothetical protein [Patescibacteria group bacterium]
MKFKIGIFGGNTKGNDVTTKKAQRVAERLLHHDVIVVTGASLGIPYVVAKYVADKGKEVWGFSSEINEKNQIAIHKHKIDMYNKIFYVPENYQDLFSIENKSSASDDFSARLKFRNILSSIHCDGVIIIGGRWGTMNEFTNMLYYKNKIVGVLTGTGGINDELPYLTKK